MAAHAAELLAKTPYPPPRPRPEDERAVLLALALRGVKTRLPRVETMQEKQVAFLRRFAATVDTLREIAAKQKAHIPRTEEERTFLQNIVQIVQTHGSGATRLYDGWYPALFYAGTEKCAEDDALVADVHTDTPSIDPPDPGCVLHQGVGGVDLMVIVLEEGEEKVVFAGPTLSHYEFEKPETTRLSDSEWQAELAAGHFPPRPVWTQPYLVAADAIPPLQVVPKDAYMFPSSLHRIQSLQIPPQPLRREG